MKVRLLAAAIAAGAAFGVQAGSLDMDTYFQLSFGQTKAKTDFASSSSGLNDSGFKLIAGIEVSPYWAIEAQYIDFGKFTDKYTYSAGYLGSVQMKTSIETAGLGLNLVGTLPIADHSLIYVKSGAHHFRSKVRVTGSQYGYSASESFSVNEWAGALGLGFLYDLTYNLSVVAEYERYFNVAGRDSVDIDFLSLGLRYTF